MYEYRHGEEITYTIYIDRASAPTSMVRLVVDNSGGDVEHLDEAISAAVSTLAEHHTIRVTESVSATGTRPYPVGPAE